MYYSQNKPGNKPNPTPEASKLARLLRDMGWYVEPEKWDGYKHIDIAIKEAKANIEVDGKHHNESVQQALADLKRTFYSFKKGWVTLRIPNCLVRDDKTIEETAEFIDKFLSESCDQIDDEDY